MPDSLGVGFFCGRIIPGEFGVDTCKNGMGKRWRWDEIRKGWG